MNTIYGPLLTNELEIALLNLLPTNVFAQFVKIRSYQDVSIVANLMFVNKNQVMVSFYDLRKR